MKIEDRNFGEEEDRDEFLNIFLDDDEEDTLIGTPVNDEEDDWDFLD